jgi:uncharacterized membrane protein
MNDKVKKVITWRILSTVCGWSISYLYLGSVIRSLELTVVIGFTMTMVHYFFEGWWENEEG